MGETVSVWISIYLNGELRSVARGAMVSAALLEAGAACRVSVTGEQRTALCGMGICFECRAVVDGVAYTRTCQLVCRDGMRVETQR
jgi:D-hydroxyproline dehydrogenase subunit gamma